MQFQQLSTIKMKKIIDINQAFADMNFKLMKKYDILKVRMCDNDK